MLMTTWEFLGIVVTAVLSTGGIVWGTLRFYYGDRSSLSRNFTAALDKTAAAFSESLKAAHQRIDRVEDRADRNEKAMRKEMRDILTEYERRTEATLNSHLGKIEMVVKSILNGGGK